MPLAQFNLLDELPTYGLVCSARDFIVVLYEPGKREQCNQPGGSPAAQLHRSSVMSIDLDSLVKEGTDGPTFSTEAVARV